MGASALEMGSPKRDQVIAVKGRGDDTCCVGLHGISHSEREDCIGYRQVTTTCGDAVKTRPRKEKTAEQNFAKGDENDARNPFQMYA
ncbi:hypothetical protein [Afipia birgiae]|uniref:hypothetical protein n=1 Tax=Afipia birgiae TaxID=151414 RepID=UPI001FCB53E2|nr:hypothetical protein [Afipia birgiae]